MKFKIKKEKIQEFNESKNFCFPKYTSQLINWANQNAQATRPKNVGQLSELFIEYKNGCNNVTIDGWQEWYLNRYPNSIDEATKKITLQIENLKEAIQLIDENMVHNWVEDLIISKTFDGLYVQGIILLSLAEMFNEEYRLATPDEEAKGIDGYVGSVAYSIKPDTYKTMDRLPESIDVKMIFYSKKNGQLSVEVEE